MDESQQFECQRSNFLITLLLIRSFVYGPKTWAHECILLLGFSLYSDSAIFFSTSFNLAISLHVFFFFSSLTKITSKHQLEYHLPLQSYQTTPAKYSLKKISQLLKIFSILVLKFKTTLQTIIFTWKH